MQQEVEQILAHNVNPQLAKLGYWVDYRRENTGGCNTTEHRLYVRTVSTAEQQPQISNLDLLRQLLGDLTPTTANADTKFAPSRDVQHTIVCLHASVSRLFAWYLSSDSPYFFAGGQPVPLMALHPFLWGALHDSMLQRLLTDPYIVLSGYFSWVTTLALVLCLGFFKETFKNDTIWYIWVGSTSAVLVFCFVIQLRSSRKSLAKSEEEWKRAIEYWKPLFAEAGWSIDYHCQEGMPFFPPYYYLRLLPCSQSTL
jgi:hypothetical protein